MAAKWMGLEDVTLILDRSKERVSLTHLVGRWLLEMASEGSSRNAMVAALGKCYDAPKLQLAADVNAFFDGLQQLPKVVFQPADLYQPDTGLVIETLGDSDPVQECSLPDWRLRVRSCNDEDCSRLEPLTPSQVLGKLLAAGCFIGNQWAPDHIRVL